MNPRSDEQLVWTLRWSESGSAELVAAVSAQVLDLLDALDMGGCEPVVRFDVDRREGVDRVVLTSSSIPRVVATWRHLANESRKAVRAVILAPRPLVLGLSESRSRGRPVDTRWYGWLHEASRPDDAQCDAVVDVVASVAGVGSPVQAFVGVEQARLAMMNAGLAHLPSEEARTFGYMWLVGLRPVEMEALGGVEAFSEVYPGSVVETGGLGMPWLARMGPTPWVSQEVLEEARVALAPCLVRTERSVRGAMHRAREVYDDSRQGRWLAEADRRLVREWAAAGD